MSAAAVILFFGSPTSSARAELLVYEPFAYPDGSLTGQGGALGTTGTWTSEESLHPGAGWRVHQEGNSANIVVAPGPVLNTFDGIVANLPTQGGYVGLPGPDDLDPPADPATDFEIGRYLDASIALNPSVTAAFTPGSTIWFSYLAVPAWDRNMEPPNVMLCTDPTPGSSRAFSLTNSGNGIGAGGGPPRNNRFQLMPRYFSGGTAYNMLGAVTAWNADTQTVPASGALSWELSDGDGFGAANIVVGKIEWDADTNGEDVITVVRFLETDVITEDAFDAALVSNPDLSSRNWLANKPDLDQSQFDLLNVAGTKFFVDEIRVGTEFGDIIGANLPPAAPFVITDFTFDPSSGMISLTWNSRQGTSYIVKYSTDMIDWSADIDDSVVGDEGATTTRSYDISTQAEGNPQLFFRIEKQ